MASNDITEMAVDSATVIASDPIVSSTGDETKPSISDQDITKALSYVSRGVELSQPRLIQRVFRQNSSIRKYIAHSQLDQTVKRFISSTSPMRSILLKYVALLAVDSKPEAVEVSMDAVDLSDPDAFSEFTQRSAIKDIPEIETFISTTVLTTLLREGLFDAAAEFSSLLIDRQRGFNRRSLDLLSSKLFFYFSFAHEKIGKLENIRPTLLALYRTSCLHRDEMGQAVLYNLLLRNYLSYNLVLQAQTFTARATFPESASNNQFCRNLYYMGRIQAVQLEYSDAYIRLTQAIRKAPQEYSKGFTVQAQKLAVIVQLLMGDIPERSLFNQPGLQLPLRPYYYLTQSVRLGDLQQFGKVVEKYSAAFKSDKNYTLVQRLGHNVLKTGLRRLSLSYSRISLADVASKLHLASVEAAEYICAKAIRDGVIEATIDHEAGWITSNEVIDVYSTEEPQKAFHRRIAFCLDVHNEAVKSMRYPPDAYKKELLAQSGKSQDAEKSIEELIQDMEDDLDDL